MVDKNIENEVVDETTVEGTTTEEVTAESVAEEVEATTEEAKAESAAEEVEATAEEVVEEAAEEANAEPSEAVEEKEGSKLFKKKKKSEKKADPMKEKVEELEDKVKRQMAEFENFRRRSEKEKAQMFEIGAKSVIEKVLPVLDNFERGLASVPAEEAELPFVGGMNMIYKQMMTELENIGVKPIEALGTEFNPDFHNAVMQVETDEFEEGIVAQELMKGYMYRDTVVRHSMVGVAQ